MEKPKIKKLKTAIAEAERFIKCANAAIERAEKENVHWSPTKEMGAAKRSSMDLTRALAEVRKPD